MKRPGAWWRGKSTPAKVETYTRWSLRSFALVELFWLGPLPFGEVPGALAWALLLALCGHAVLGSVTVSRALDWTRGRREQPVRLVVAYGTVTAVLAVATLAVLLRVPGEGNPGGGASNAIVLFVGILMVGAGMVTPGLRTRRRVIATALGASVGAGVAAVPSGLPSIVALVLAATVLFSTGVFALTSGLSVWLLNTVYELDEARETKARLAVAEERLRFGRDLHDVMGRNLAVIALKSELAIQLTRRGRPEGVEQMIEVQRIAQESQKDVRAVVRGYREADLSVELAGAQGVLTAAGITCEVTGTDAALPGPVQSALAWVVREATTNVLRHGDARRCDIAVRVEAGRVVVLSVENDGASGASGAVGNGSGLAGLRERLAEVDGTLEAGLVNGEFRVIAEVPLTEPAAEPRHDATYDEPRPGLTNATYDEPPQGLTNNEYERSAR
ncbi:histidine kinase [Streptomyces sp. NPDC046821]|uniref:sensor histidine kinase n=1 Tax=Streptomyces sp. NPDC046821 TaxID=3154702 RepID=UPI0033CFF75C